MTYYLKHRPQIIEDLDLVSVRKTLKKIVKSENIPHAFLFAGPRGSGKTSAARILAKVANCEKPTKSGEPCNDCDQCRTIISGNNLDVIEMDAASNRGIDDIRNLRDQVSLAPARAKKKVYIIDEVHMLTTEAFNAFLKTLEEPPEHVMFILATTDPHKIPETVRSRLTAIPFTKASPKEVRSGLNRVIKKEKIKIEDAAVSLISESSDGSFRDAVKALEHLVSLTDKKITEEMVKENLSDLGSINTDKLFSLIRDGDSKKIITEIEEMMEKGASARNILKTMMEMIHKGLLSLEGIKSDKIEGFTKQELLDLYECLVEQSSYISYSPVEQLPLECAIINYLIEPDELKKKAPQNESVNDKPQSTENNDPQKVKTNSRQKMLSKKDFKGGVSAENWSALVSKIGESHTSVEALLRAAFPLEYDGKTLTVGVYYKFHKEQLEAQRNRTILEKIAGEYLGDRIKINCVLTEKEKDKKVKETLKKSESVLSESEDEDVISAAKEIFGVN